MKPIDGRVAAAPSVRRIGTYRSLLGDMVRGAPRLPPLARLNLEAAGDFTPALLGAWARVCDVLGFYQERIGAEGYLSTATEPLSVQYLAAAVGERRRPPLAARTHLALQLIDVPGQPDRLAFADGQTLVVQSVPDAGGRPVVFECADPGELRRTWNAIPVARRSSARPAEIFPGCRSLRLSGTATGMRPGTALLLDAPAPGKEPQSWLAIVASVEIDRRSDWTLVTCAQAIPGAPGAWRRPVRSVTAFDRAAGLFGRTAALWPEVPEKTKAAVGARQGGILTLERRGPAAAPGSLWRAPPAPPPRGEVRALETTQAGLLVAATSAGVLRLDEGGAEWTPLPLPPGRHDVTALTRGGDGRLYAGTAAGLVAVSADGGDSWTALPDLVKSDPPPPAAGDLLRFIRSRGRPEAAERPWSLAGPIRTLAVADDGPDAPPRIFAGTGQGVLAIALGDLSWTAFNAGLPVPRAESDDAGLAVTSLLPFDDRLVAATDRGLFVSPAKSPVWTRAEVPLPPGAVVNCLARSGRLLLAGTSAGLFATGDLKRWGRLDSGRGTAGRSVLSLAASGRTLFAVAGDGLYVADPWTTPWRKADTQELFLFRAAPGLEAGLAERRVGPALRDRFASFGIRLADEVAVAPVDASDPDGDGGEAWTLTELPPPGGPPGRVFRVHAGPPARVTELVGILPAAGSALTATPGGAAAALAPGPWINGEWPDFIASGIEIFLDRKVEGAEAGTRMLVLPQGADVPQQPLVHRVRRAETVLHKAFGKRATVTRIVLDSPISPSDPRTADVHLSMRTVSPFTSSVPEFAPVAGPSLILEGSHRGLAAGRLLQVSGPRAAAIVLRHGQVHEGRDFAFCDAEAAPALDQETISAGLRSALAAAGAKLSFDCRASIVRPGETWLIRDGDRAWILDLPPGPPGPRLRIVAAPILEVVERPAQAPGEWVFSHRGALHRIAAADDEVLWQPACSFQESVAEIASVAGAAVDAAAGETRIGLASPLQHLYDPTACRIGANVVPATQGETVAHEVLGSGDPSQPWQRFRLRCAPLTYRTDPESGREVAELRVEVNGQASRALRFGGSPASAGAPAEDWQETGSLALEGPGRRAFEVRLDEAGRTMLRFGDGLHGARLPSGADNVSASYRCGGGAAGNVAAGTLKTFKKRPVGIRSVTNPVAACGGADAEPIEALRARAAGKLRHGGRIVTASDYEGWARSFPGVGKAQVDPIDEGGLRAVHLTVATAGGGPLPAPVLGALRSAIAEARSDALPLVVAAPALAAFALALEVVVGAGTDRKALEEEARAALAFRFDPVRREIGQPVHAWEALEAVGAIGGVESVVLQALHRRGASPARSSRLDAKRARRGPGASDLLPAELLVLGGAGEIRLSIRS